MFIGKLAQHREPTFDENIDAFASNMSNIFYECASKSVVRMPIPNVDVTVNRWERLLNENDSTAIGRAINWRGELQTNSTLSGDTSSPSDEEFIEHFTQLYDHSSGMLESLDDLQTDVYVPILDYPISYNEIQSQIKRLKSGKATGPDGVPPWFI